MTIYIVRHGETEFNKLGIVQGSSVDTDLNDKGRSQAKAFYDHHQHVDFKLVVTSALKRTHQTVQGFIDKGLPWHITPDINEITWGHHEGKVISSEYKVLWDEVRNAWNSGDLSARMPGGESAQELNDRLVRFIDWLKQRTEDHVLVCMHGRSMRGLVSLLKGVSLAEMEGNPHVNTGFYVAKLQDGAFYFTAENATPHLVH
jgi:phosphoserine phosphatase